MSLQEFLLEAHGGWRYLVILATVGVMLFFAYALATKNTKEKQESTALKIWAGIMDMQLLLGLVLLIYYFIEGLHRAQLIGHWTLGIVAVFIAHIPTIYRRLNGKPNAQTRRIMGLVLPILAFLTIYFGLAAIERGLFG